MSVNVSLLGTILHVRDNKCTYSKENYKWFDIPGMLNQQEFNLNNEQNRATFSLLKSIHNTNSCAANSTQHLSNIYD